MNLRRLLSRNTEIEHLPKGSFPPARTGQRRQRRLRLELLEDRTLLATNVFINPNGGSWSTPTNWSLGRAPLANDDVSLPALANGASVTYGPLLDVTLNNLALDAPLALDGFLGVNGSIDGTGSVVLAGKLSGGTVGSEISVVGEGGTLSGVTLNGNLEVAGPGATSGTSVTIEDGLALNGTITVGTDTLGGSLEFIGTQTLTGTGSVLFSNAPFGSNLFHGSSLTIGPHITVKGPNVRFYGTFVDEGTIEIDGGEFGGGHVIPLPVNLSIADTGKLELLDDTTGYLYTQLTNAGSLTIADGSTLYTNQVFGADYTQTATGTLHLQLGSSLDTQEPLVGYGITTLAGSLTLSYVDGFTPSPGKSYQLIASPTLSGAFATVVGGSVVCTSDAVYLKVAPIVTTPSDSGPGSLRDVINNVNNDPTSGTDEITFASSIQGGTITIQSPLPAISRNGVTISGPSQRITIDGSALSSGGLFALVPSGFDISGNDDEIQDVTIRGFKGNGILITGQDDTVLGSEIVANAGDGIKVDHTQHAIVQGNWIGTDAMNHAGLGNGGNGVDITDDSSNNTIGAIGNADAPAEGNTIADNGGDGVVISTGHYQEASAGNGVRQNLIYGNYLLPIELGIGGLVPNSPGGPHSGPNDSQNYPEITESRDVVNGQVVQGYLNSASNAAFTVDIYAIWEEINPATGDIVAQGAQILGSPQTVRTDNNGNAVLRQFPANITPISLLNIGDVLQVALAGTATDGNNNTSEFGLYLAPSQVRSAYGFNNLPKAADGTVLNGAGQTIAIVIPYDDPTLFSDLGGFDAQFHIPAVGNPGGPSLRVYNDVSTGQLAKLNGTTIYNNGVAVTLPGVDPMGLSELEESLDVEWAHAIAPGANIDVVETSSSGPSTLLNGAKLAGKLPGVCVVSMSWGAFGNKGDDEVSNEAEFDPAFVLPGVAFVGASGDDGANAFGYPPASPNVLAVGGTTLALNADGSYDGEIGWGYQTASGGWDGSGGGQSLYETRPSYQVSVQGSSARTVPDVAFVGGTLVAVADSNKAYNAVSPGNAGWMGVDGTSLSAPCWAGLLAIVDQGRAAAGKQPLNASTPLETQTALYTLPPSDFHDNLGGANGAIPPVGTLLDPQRYDEVTGLGTPVADLLVPDLISYGGIVSSTAKLLQGIPSGQMLLGSSPVQTNEFLSAQVEWGDGSSDSTNEANSPITISVSGNVAKVFSSHTFANSGLLTITVALTDSNGTNDRSYMTAEVAAGVSSQVAASRSGLVYNRGTKQFYGSITLTNSGTTSINGSLDILLQGLTSKVSLAYATVTIGGTTYSLTIGEDGAGDPYIQIPQTVLRSLAAGQSLSIAVRFNNPSLGLVGFTPKVFSDPFNS